MIEKRNGFTRLDLLVSLVVLMSLAAMQIPAINAARSAAHQNACSRNLHRIALALHNHHDVYKTFPTLAAHVDHLPGLKSASTASGMATHFSWQVRILPYLEREPGKLYNGISKTSDRFRRPAFDKRIRAAEVHPAFIAIPEYRCAAFTGTPTAVAKEFESLPEDISQGDGVAISNYVALAATHVGLMVERPSKANGVLVPNRGKAIASITDGLHSTAIVTESREQHYASWYDATCTWVVGLPSELPSPQQDRLGRWLAPRGTPGPLHYGPKQGTNEPVYLAEKRWSNGDPRRWGPSSDHPDNVVMHAFADASTRPLRGDINPTVYFALITRDNSDALKDDVLETLGINDANETKENAKSPRLK